MMGDPMTTHCVPWTLGRGKHTWSQDCGIPNVTPRTDRISRARDEGERAKNQQWQIRQQITACVLQAGCCTNAWMEAARAEAGW